MDHREPGPIRALLIDLDGIIRVWNPAANERAERLADLPAGAIGRAAFARERLLPAITGQIRDEEWRQQIIARLRAEFPDRDVARAVERWSESPGMVDRAALDVVGACRHRVPVVLVTNATSRLDRDLRRLELIDQFDGIVNSSAVGWVKPQPEIFDIALRMAGVPAAQAVFVDDTVENVSAAAELGLRAHLYRGADDLRREMARRRLL